MNKTISEASSAPTVPSAEKDRLARLDAYLREDPNNEPLLADAVAQAILCQDWARADFYLRHAQSLNLSPLPWQLREVEFWMAQARYREARALLHRLQLQPQLAPAMADIVLHNLAWIEGQEGRWAEAVDLLAPRLVAPAPGQPVMAPALQTLWLRALHRDGQLEKALAWAHDTHSAAMLAAEASGVASLVALDQNDLAAAQAWSGEALDGSAAAPSMEAMVTRASLALAAQDAHAAMQWADAALLRNPGDGRALSTRGFAALLAQQPQEALGYFDRALQGIDRHVGTWLGRGWTQLLLGLLDGAQESFETAVRLDRNFAEGHGSLAVALALKKNVPASREAIGRANGLDKVNLSGQYAEALLAGEITGPQAMQQLALRLLRGRADLRDSAAVQRIAGLRQR